MISGSDQGASFRPTQARINLGALAHNFHLLKKSVAPGAFFCPMVKANAYGHGDVAVASRLRREGATHLGVALIEEALGLRAAGDRGGLLYFGMFDHAGAEAMLEHHITPVISTVDGFQTLIDVVGSSAAKSLIREEPLAFHLELNTGMNRLGLDPREVAMLASRIKKSSNIVRLEGLATHFSDGDDFGGPGERTKEQMRRFEVAEKELRAAGVKGFQAHVANSSALRAISAIRRGDGNLLNEMGARPGIALYGVEPDTASAPVFGLEPVLSFESCVTHVQQIGVGERVSYGGRWTAGRPSRVGVIPCGYADGYRRSVNSQPTEFYATPPSVIVRGRRVPILGTICMDYFMCDLTEVQDAVAGEKVTFIGTDGDATILATDMAAWAQTISYEVFTGISARVPRVYVDDGPFSSVPLKP